MRNQVFRRPTKEAALVAAFNSYAASQTACCFLKHFYWQHTFEKLQHKFEKLAAFIAKTPALLHF